MKRITRFSLYLLLGLWITILPNVFGLKINQASAENDIFPERISGLVPASGSYATSAPPTISAAFSYQLGATYFSANIYIDGIDMTSGAAPNAGGFSFSPNIGQGNHQVKVIMVDSLGSVAIRNWSFNLDSVPPTTHVSALTAFTKDLKIAVPITGYDQTSGVQSVELFYQKNTDPWQSYTTVLGLPQTIAFDIALKGQNARYAFMTVGYDQAGLKENKPFVEEASTIADSIKPAAVNSSKVVIEQKGPGQNITSPIEDSIVCLPGSVADDTAQVYIYGNDETKPMIASPVFGTNGAKRCGAYGISQYTKIRMVAVDAAGNQSEEVVLNNNPTVGAAPTNFQLIKVNSETVLLRWTQVLGARAFRIRHRELGQTVWSDYIELQSQLDNATIDNLDPTKAYQFAIATVDYFGNESSMVTLSSTVGKTAVTAASTSGQSVETSEETSQTTTPEEQKATPKTEEKQQPPTGQKEEVKPNNTTNETGEVKGEESNEEQAETSRNWTPWIVLAILIILAGAATGGYFYWFGGPEEITTTITTDADKKEKNQEKEAENHKDKDQEARW